MAWLVADPSQGSGNGSVSLTSSSPNTGRNARVGTATWTGPGVPDVQRKVNQAGKPQFVTIQSAAAAGKDGATVTITGTSNSSKLKFTLGTGALVIAIPPTYRANGVDVNNDTAIAGDPGATAQFSYSIEIVVPENEGIEAISRQIVVTDAAGNQATSTITQAAGNPIMEITPDEQNMDWEGNPVAFNVSSNIQWTVVTRDGAPDA